MNTRLILPVITFFVFCLSFEAHLLSSSHKDFSISERPILIPGITSLSKLTEEHITKWVNAGDRLRDLLIESLAMQNSEHHNYTCHEIKEKTPLEMEKEANLEHMIKEISDLTVKSLLNVFCDPHYHTNLHPYQMKEIEKIFTCTYASGRTYLNFSAIAFPRLKISFGSSEGYRENDRAYICTLAPHNIKKYYYQVLAQHNFSRVKTCYAPMTYDVLHYAPIIDDKLHDVRREENLFQTDQNVPELHFRPQVHLERIKQLETEIYGYFIGHLWHGSNAITAEIAKHIMLKINDDCNNLNTSPSIKKNLVRTIKVIEITLELAKIYEQTFQATEDIRYSKLGELKKEFKVVIRGN